MCSKPYAAASALCLATALVIAGLSGLALGAQPGGAPCKQTCVSLAQGTALGHLQASNPVP